MAKKKQNKMSGVFTKIALKGILALVPEMFKDNKGKWSSKRTVSGVLAVAAVAQIEADGLSWQILCLALIAVLPLCFLGDEKCNKCDKSKLTKIFNKKN
tara:strand:+ start:19801 stop:20097 length:297 start_codon:yes stop_codon:yes gene_type:complete